MAQRPSTIKTAKQRALIINANCPASVVDTEAGQIAMH